MEFMISFIWFPTRTLLSSITRARSIVEMALRALVRLRSTCGLQLRTLAQTSQDARKVFSCGFSADASTDEVAGSHAEDKLENPVVLSDATVQFEGSEDTQFEGSIKVGAPYLRFIVGRRGMTKKNIEKEANAIVVIPPARDVRSNASLVVRGASQESVDKALAGIQAVLQRAEKLSTLEFTHFISMPLVSREGLVEQLRSFKNSVLKEEQTAKSYVSWFPETAGKVSSNTAAVDTSDKSSKVKSSRVLDPDLEGFFSDDESSDDENERHESPLAKISGSLFIKPETVHLTVLMMKLFTDERIKEAAEVLQGVQSRVLEILDGHELKVHLKGLDCFRGTPSKASVVAIKVQEPDKGSHLHRACRTIRDAYKRAGFSAVPDMMLHATVMNVSRRYSIKPFDARKILAKYRLQDWGEHSINEVHLSQRFFYDESGYYRCCGSFQLPSQSSG